MLNDILERAYRQLGNPVAAIDTSYNLLAATENPVADDPLWNELLKQKKFSHKTVDFFNEAKFIQTVADSDVVSLLASERLPYDRACGKFFDSAGVQLGSISVVACQRPFVPEDFRVIAAVCEEISEQNSASGPDGLHAQVFALSWVSELLDGTLSPGRLEELVRNHAGCAYFLCVVDVSQYESTLSHLAYFQDTFRALRPDYEYFIYLNYIVILMEAKGARPCLHREFRELYAFFRRYRIYAGVSGRFEGLSGLKEQYRQAITALNRGTAKGTRKHIFRVAPAAGRPLRCIR